MLTTEQKAVVASDIAADPVFSVLPPSSDSAFEIASQYSVIVNPAFIVWRTTLPFSEIMESFIAEDWTAMDNLTVGQDRIWINLRDMNGINPSKTAHQAALTECWKGTAAKVAVKDRILGMGKRSANRLEKLLATGTGTTASPAKMGFEGTVNYNEIKEVMGW